MPIVDRVKAILMSPKTEWPVIEAESTDIAGVYRNYVIYLAAIPAIAMFIGMSVFGFGGFGVTVRVPFFSGLINAVISYVLSLVMLYVLGLIVNALAPTFKGQKSPVNAFKVVAYGSTASMVAGILYLIPSLSMLVFLGALYSIYLIYIGLPVLMKCPPDKAMPYTAVIIVCGFVAALLLSVVSNAFLPGQHMRMSDAGGGVTIKTPSGEVTIDPKKAEEAARKLEAATKQIESSGKAADPAAAGKAVAEALGAMAAATGGREPLPAELLKAALPESIGDMKRSSFESQGGAAMGIKGSTVRAEYGSGDRTVKLEIMDVGGLAGLMAMAGWMNITGEKENDREVERIYKSGKRTIKEHLSKSDGRAGYTVVLENGVIVEGSGRGVDLAGMKKIVEGLNLGALETAKGKG